MSYVGQSIPMMTNSQLVAGKGTFVDDVQLPGMTFMAVLRSPYAHARIRSIDTTAAEALPGVLAVVTGREISEQTNPIPETYDTAAVGAKGVEWYALCVDRARFVGEAVAAVVAEDRFSAYEALDLIEVDYEELPAVSDPEQALEPGSPLVEPDWGDNLMASRDIRLGDPDAAFAEADGVVEGVVKSARITGAAIEPRGCVASWDPYREVLTFWDSTQAPHAVRMYLAKTLGMTDTSLRVIQPHVGGAFGLKLPTFQEEPLCAYLSMKVGRPVKWIETRAENLLVGGHARDTSFRYKAAYKADGELTGIKLDVIADVGAPSALCGWGMSFVTWYCLPCVYKCQNSETHLRSVVTNKCPWNAYRGYGKDAASLLMERIMDHIARATGIDRAEVRFRNFVQPEEFPYPQVSGAMLDSGNYPGALRKVMEMVGYADFPAMQAEARREGRRIGLGIAMELTPEGCSMPGSLMLNGTDSTEVRITPNGNVIVLTGITSPGSGNETGIAQIVADALHCDIARVSVVQGDTETCPWGFGNYSSRSIIIGGSAAQVAGDEIHEKMRTVAANMLEASADDLEVVDERFRVRGSGNGGIAFEDVAREVYASPHGKNMDGVEPMLQAVRQSEDAERLPPAGDAGPLQRLPVVALRRRRGDRRGRPRYGPRHHPPLLPGRGRGTIVNPLLADANLHGGIAQGIGGAMYERIAYDEAGQPLTATFMDYTLPTAVELPGARDRPSGDAVAVHPARNEGRRRVRCRRHAWCALQRDRKRAAGGGPAPRPSCHSRRAASGRRCRELDSGRRGSVGRRRMLSTDFEFFAPTELSDALRLLDEKGPGAKILAGGMSMVPTVNLGLLRPDCVVSLNHVGGLDEVQDARDELRIGAMVRHARIAADPAISSPRAGARGRRVGDRRRAGPQPRHDRRQRGACRPLGGLPAGARRARRDGRRRRERHDTRGAGACVLPRRDDDRPRAGRDRRRAPRAETRPPGRLGLRTARARRGQLRDRQCRGCGGRLPLRHRRRRRRALARARRAGARPLGGRPGPRRGRSRCPCSLRGRVRRPERERRLPTSHGRRLCRARGRSRARGARRHQRQGYRMTTPISVTVNGVERNVVIDTRLTLVYLLRESLGLTGTHVGCATGNCGACTVVLDGKTVKSCSVFAADVSGSEILTVEGLSRGARELHPVQQVFVEHQGLQCGFCTPGMVLSAIALLEQNPNPSEADIRHAIAGNLCRCTGYQFIVESIQAAAAASG